LLAGIGSGLDLLSKSKQKQNLMNLIDKSIKHRDFPQQVHFIHIAICIREPTYLLYKKIKENERKLNGLKKKLNREIIYYFLPFSSSPSFF